MDKNNKHILNLEVPIDENEDIIIDILDIDKTIEKIKKHGKVYKSNCIKTNKEFICKTGPSTLIDIQIQHRLFNLIKSSYDGVIILDFYDEVIIETQDRLNLIVADRKYNIYNIWNNINVLLDGDKEMVYDRMTISKKYSKLNILLILSELFKTNEGMKIEKEDRVRRRLNLTTIKLNAIANSGMY